MATPDDLVHCPICLELYIQPRALPCLHSFCDTCLQEYINAAGRKASIANGFGCPICRRHTAPPSPANNDHTGWSKLFPLNHIVITLLDARECKPDISTTNDDKRASSTSGSRFTSSHTGLGTSDNTASNTQDFPPDSAFHVQKDNYDTRDDSSNEDTDQEYWPPPPPHPHYPPPHGPPPHHRHPHGPPPHGPPPLHGPPYPHWPPPHHHRPHYRGRGCHGPHGGPRGGHGPRGPHGRFPHHGPRHRHHPPPF